MHSPGIQCKVELLPPPVSSGPSIFRLLVVKTI